MIWDERHECMHREDLEALQAARLRETVRRVYEHVPYYRQTLDGAGVKPEDIQSIDDLRRLPFTVKDDLRQNYPYGLFAVPIKEVVRVHASSGTTGKPTVVGYTKNDIDTWAELIARIVTLAGVTPEDVAQVCFGYGLFTGAFGLHYGLERVGATVVPASGGNSEKQIMLMQDFGTTALIGTPSYAMYLAEVAEQVGVNPAKLPVRVGLFGGEGHTEEMRRELERRWDFLATDNYGLSEVIGPGVSGECQFQDGMHINEDHFIAEIVDPATGEPLPYGEYGELVLTSLTKEALPVIRYRTKDITRLNPEPCRCGRTTARMSKPTGRTDDMLVIRGVNVFPSQIESVLVEIDGVAPHYQLIVSRKGFLDELEVQVEMAEAWFTDRFKELEHLERRIKHKLQSVLSISAKVSLVEPRTLARSEGKAKRVIDLRKSGS
ncbi:phenylacetate--CoA ligase [Clostridiales bacterium PH28_bin88]|nr:phenylacetate--CoA ligase [Clostridiales bacterium PH28_bin88]